MQILINFEPTFMAFPVDTLRIMASTMLRVNDLNSSFSVIELGSTCSQAIPSKQRSNPPKHLQQFARMFIKL